MFWSWIANAVTELNQSRRSFLKYLFQLRSSHPLLHIWKGFEFADTSVTTFIMCASFLGMLVVKCENCHHVLKVLSRSVRKITECVNLVYKCPFTCTTFLFMSHICVTIQRLQCLVIQCEETKLLWTFTAATTFQQHLLLYHWYTVWVCCSSYMCSITDKI